MMFSSVNKLDTTVISSNAPSLQQKAFDGVSAYKTELMNIPVIAWHLPFEDYTYLSQGNWIKFYRLS